jgi:XapX domain-containing protein
MKEVFYTTLTGTAVGAIFSILKLPIPAPPVFAGLMGIVGLWIGFGIVQRFISWKCFFFAGLR